MVFLTSCRMKTYQSNSVPVSHDVFTELLQKHVSKDGKVNYVGFRNDSVAFNKYLKLLSSHHPNSSWTRNEQLAYWVNAYNAFTIQLVSEHYPVESIKKIKNGIPFINSVWDIRFIEIEGERYDLNNIEHNILHPVFKDPRVHFAINCASISCPNLLNEAYVSSTLDQQLNEATKRFLSDTNKNLILQDQLQVSKIFLWFGKDFKQEDGIIGFINKYYPLKVNKKAKIGYLDYNWGLNDLK